MKSREELRRQLASNPTAVAEYALQLQEQLTEARAYIADLQRQLFGPKADKLSPEQEEQLRQVAGELQEHNQRPPPVSQEVLEADLPPKDKEKLKREARQRRHPLPAVQLEVQRVVLEPDHKVCGTCQEPGRKIGEEVTTEYEYVAAKLLCKETVRPKYAHECSCAPKAVSIAPLPPRLVPQSKLGLGLAVYILLSRFDDHIAYYTPHPQGDVFLEFCTGRGREGPQQRLAGFTGTIQTDAYGVYDSLRRQRPTTLKRLGCLAHIRRKWYKAAEESCAQAIWFIGQIRQLYRIEDETRDLEAEQRKTIRRQKAPALWRAMKRRALELKANPRLLPQSSLGKALKYFLGEYTAAVGYLREGKYEIDNNLVENDVRPSVVGRKRWLFIGHPDAGWRSALIYTIIQSCRRRGINPQEYLTDVLRRLPSMTTQQVKDLLPSRWKPAGNGTP
jgi:transposase